MFVRSQLRIITANSTNISSPLSLHVTVVMFHLDLLVLLVLLSLLHRNEGRVGPQVRILPPREVMYTLEVVMDLTPHGSTLPPGWPTDGTPPVLDVYFGEEPHTATERFASTYGLTGDQAQRLLDSVCGPATDFACERTTMLRAATFMPDASDLSRSHLSRIPRTSADGAPIPAARFVPAVRTCTDHAAQERGSCGSGTANVPEGMVLVRSHVLGGRELFVVDNVVEDVELRRRWCRELEACPMKRQIQDAPLTMPVYVYRERGCVACVLCGAAQCMVHSCVAFGRCRCRGSGRGR